MTILENISPTGKKKLLIFAIIVFLIFVVVPITLMLLHEEEEPRRDPAPVSELAFSNDMEVFDVLGISTMNSTHIRSCATSLILSDQERASSPDPYTSDTHSTIIYNATIESFKEILLDNEQVYSYSLLMNINDGRSYNLYYGYDQRTVGGEYIFIAVQSPKTDVTYLCTRPSEDIYVNNAKVWTKNIPEINQDKLEVTSFNSI